MSVAPPSPYAYTTSETVPASSPMTDRPQPSSMRRTSGTRSTSVTVPIGPPHSRRLLIRPRAPARVSTSGRQPCRLGGSRCGPERGRGHHVTLAPICCRRRTFLGRGTAHVAHEGEDG